MTDEYILALAGAPRGSRFIARRARNLVETLETALPPASGVGVSSLVARACLLGSTPWTLELQAPNGRLSFGIGVVTRGRRRAGLHVQLLKSNAGDDALFWQAVIDFSNRLNVTDIVAESVGHSLPATPIPHLAHEQSRISNERLYIVDLRRPESERPFSSLATKNLVRATKAGIEMMAPPAEQALAAHFRLKDASLNRRASRGESTELKSSEDTVANLLRSGHGRLYQAGKNGEVLSSQFVFTLNRRAYHYDGGTSPEGMKVNASHFLQAQVIRDLPATGVWALDLGIAASDKPGLIAYKEGFGPDLWVSERVSAGHNSYYKMLRNLLSSVFAG